MSTDDPGHAPQTPSAQPHDTPVPTQELFAQGPADAPETPPGPPPSYAGGYAATPAKASFSDRLWSLRAMLAVAAASVIIGGAGGAIITAAASGDHGRVVVKPGRGFGGMMGPRRFDRGPGVQRPWQQQQQQAPPPSPPTPSPSPSPKR